MKFLANENFPLASIKLLRKQGYYVSSISEESSGIKDNQVLMRATNENLIILTFDRDYGELIYKCKMPSPEGIIYFRYHPLTPTEPAEHLLNLLTINTVTFSKRFTVLERTNLRQRLLPL